MTGADADFYSDFNKATENSVVITRGNDFGRISLKADSDRLFVLIGGELHGAHFLECFREGLETGVLHPNMRTLVDLTGFTGAVDWGAVFTLRTLTSWGNKGVDQSRVAYVVRNDMFGALIKIVRVLFFNTQHRTFDNYVDAIAWLQSPP